MDLNLRLPTDEEEVARCEIRVRLALYIYKENHPFPLYIYKENHPSPCIFTRRTIRRSQEDEVPDGGGEWKPGSPARWPQGAAHPFAPLALAPRAAAHA